MPKRKKLPSRRSQLATGSTFLEAIASPPPACEREWSHAMKWARGIAAGIQTMRSAKHDTAKERHMVPGMREESRNRVEHLDAQITSSEKTEYRTDGADLSAPVLLMVQ